MQNSIKEVISYLEENPFRTESEICQEVWGFYRNRTWESNKKYAELIRRGLRSGKIHRVAHKKGRSKFVYFVVPKENIKIRKIPVAVMFM